MTLKVDGTNGVLQAYDYQVLTTGFTYTFAAGVQLLLAVPAGTLATGTVTMPASPVDGMNITISSTQQITALTVNGNTGQSIVGGATSLKAGGAQTFVYRLSNTTWYNQSNNATIVTGYSGVNGQAFTSNGTFTIPANITTVKVTVVGGGAGGGSSYTGGGCGGGGGGGAVKYLTGLTSGATLAVTVGAAGAGGTFNNNNAGAGGTSSVASGTQSITTISATGGVRGSQAPNQVGGVNGYSSGGVGSGGDMNTRGGGGHSGGMATDGSSFSFAFGGGGGSSLLGGGAPGTFNTTNVLPPSGYGGGGSGASANSNGYAGSAGVVLFEW